jgi:hypothetical protein
MKIDWTNNFRSDMGTTVYSSVSKLRGFKMRAFTSLILLLAVITFTACHVTAGDNNERKEWIYLTSEEDTSISVCIFNEPTYDNPNCDSIPFTYSAVRNIGDIWMLKE